MTEGQTLSNGPSIQMKDDIPEIYEQNHSSSRVAHFACVLASCDIAFSGKGVKSFSSLKVSFLSSTGGNRASSTGTQV
ncbi:hypothetical protein JMJ77_0009210 [Colletotrichum scovillei]|uniref:Uncharacterized protein n=1 Tax=Colletotrichum scovillei TaxID=1209932 RepID=A0A9P7QXT0_9PEZI|nr:hypothetical protein JMJ77_0009210 [Colletotrichum scovillei]KAG7052285.1 hypothetical protein JMJ78_0005306 [Colletotrichum scovillei]KAG7064576.1 hypothetical protein JMJ76_0012339 [Colletotrichum scovillei]